MSRQINSVAVLGGGTMGTGIAGACASDGVPVLLLDVTREAAERSLKRITDGKPPALDDPDKASLITLGTFEQDLGRISEFDWICEAIIEDLATKRALFQKLEPLRRDGSVVSTNTSGIPLNDISADMPERLRRDIAVTHFFNPVKVMRLMELIPGTDTELAVIDALAAFCGERLGKGVVYAKDTVNFIGNRIGCFWMLSGLHKAKPALADGVSMEMIDTLMGKPVGLPPTGLYGLIDLIGLDVMDLVGKNLAINLPEGDRGRAYTAFPAAEQAMLARGQLGRKSGGGFYRVNKLEDGSRLKEVFDLTTESWRQAATPDIPDRAGDAAGLLYGDDAIGKFAWDLMGGALVYAADLVPEIADDIVNIDRAMKWGFNWRQGPFELLDSLEPSRFIERLAASGEPMPKMLATLRDAGAETFYRQDGSEYLGRDGAWHPVPPE